MFLSLLCDLQEVKVPGIANCKVIPRMCKMFDKLTFSDILIDRAPIKTQMSWLK